MSYSTPTMSVIPVRPLSVSDLFQATFTIYRNRFPLFLLLGVIPSVISLVIIFAGVALMVGGLLPLLIYAMDGNPTTAGPSVLVALGGIAVILIGSLVAAVSSYVCNALIAAAVVQMDRGLVPTLRSLWHQNRGLPGRAFSLYLLTIGLVLAIGIVMALLIAVFIALEVYWVIFLLILATVPLWVIALARLGLILQVVAIEEVDGLEAVRRCWRLTAGAGGRIFGLLILVQLLVGMATQTVAGITQTLAGTFTEQLTSGNPDPFTIVTLLVPALLLGVGVTQALSVLAGPFVSIYTAILYVDQRRRKEAAAGLPLFS